MSFELTNDQLNAINLAKEWYLNDKTEKPFIIQGVAGSGKSTIIKYLIEELGIDTDNVAYVTFTGKAASVLNNKGVPATTIHKLIYDPIENEEVVKKKEKLIEGIIEEDDTKRKKRVLDNSVYFFLKEEISKKIELIVVDEYSMVSKEIMEDLFSFKRKIICLGDQYQLPPVFGNISDVFKKPDVILNEPLRQALDNPIIYLANLARQHKTIKLGTYGDNVKVISRNNLPLQDFKDADQIIAGKNDTVKKLNNFYRNRILNIDSNQVLPIKGEKLICLRNNWNLECCEDSKSTALINGLNCYLENDIVESLATETAIVNLRPDFYDNHCFKNIPIDLLYFKYNFNKESEIWDNINKYGYRMSLQKRKFNFIDAKDINKFTYGYAITCHKSQGSEFKKVFYIFEPMGRNKWELLYTGITRASEELILVI